MNILCCFKLVNDYDLVMEKDWLSASSSGIDLSYAKRIINCYDEAGLETAIRIKESAESLGDKVSVTALTVGNGNYEPFFKNLFAVGIERIIQVKAPSEQLFVPNRIASILFEAATLSKYDAIITGIQSADSSSGLTPFLLAEKLKIPCISNVTALQYADGALRATCDNGRGIRRATVNTRALYAVGNSTSPYLRMATLKQKLAVSKMTAEIFEPSELSQSFGTGYELCSLSREKADRHCVFLQGENCDELAKNLFSAYPEVMKA